MVITSAFVILFDSHKSSVFTCGTTMRLGRDTIVMSDCNEIVFDLLKHGFISSALVLWSEWMHVCESKPCHWNHCYSGIELHGARTKRNHGVSKTDILICKSLDVSHHVGLREFHSENILVHVLVGSSKGILNWHVLAGLILLDLMELVSISLLH